MRKVLSAVLLSMTMWVVALGQGTVAGPQLTHTSASGAFTPRALVDVRKTNGQVICSQCVDGFWGTYLFKVNIVGSDGQSYPAVVFRAERFKISYAIPLMPVGISSITVTGPMLSDTVTFVPVISSNPQLTNSGFLVALQNTSWNPNIENGVVNKPRNTIKIVIFGSGFGNGGTFIFRMTNRATGVAEDFIGQVLPRSSFDPRDQANWEVPADIASGVYDVFAYDPNEPGIVSNTIQLTIN